MNIKSNTMLSNLAEIRRHVDALDVAVIELNRASIVRICSHLQSSLADMVEHAISGSSFVKHLNQKNYGNFKKNSSMVTAFSYLGEMPLACPFICCDCPYEPVCSFCLWNSENGSDCAECESKQYCYRYNER